MYPTTAELVAASTDEALLASTPAQQDALRAAAIVAVERFCRQSFEAEGTEAAPAVLTVPGAGIDEIRLPRRVAILSSVTADGYVLNEADYRLGTGGQSLKLTSIIGGSWLTRVRRIPGDGGPAFRAGADVVVAGVFGWTDAEWAAGTLDAVATAIRFDMEDQAEADANKLAQTVRSARALGVENVSQGGLSMALRPGEPGISVRAQRRLLALRWVGPVGALA